MFKNPQIPEGINTSKEHPLKEFFILILGAGLLVLVLVVALGWFGGVLARWVPFEVELKVAEQFDPVEDDDSPLYGYLDGLRERIITAMPLNENFRILLRYQDSETINAFATLGGNVILFRGLLEKLPHENALAMLLAHEIAHVQHRDPMVGLGRGVLIQLGLAGLFGHSASIEDIFGQAGMLQVLRYTRNMETAADETALYTVVKLYGHASGSTDLFEVIRGLRGGKNALEPPEFFSTHPLDQKRIELVRELASKNQWKLDAPITPLPDSFQRWLKDMN